MASGMSTTAIKMACWLHCSCPDDDDTQKMHRCQIWQFRRAAAARCVRAKSKRVWFLRLDPRDMPWSHRELGAAAVLWIARGVFLTAVARGSKQFLSSSFGSAAKTAWTPKKQRLRTPKTCLPHPNSAASSYTCAVRCGRRQFGRSNGLALTR